MEGLKMAHHSNPTALPSIHRGSKSSLKLAGAHPEYSHIINDNNRVSHASAKSIDNCNTLSNADLAASIEALLPSASDDDHIDMGRIRIERRSHKQLLPPSVSYIFFIT